MFAKALLATLALAAAAVPAATPPILPDLSPTSSLPINLDATSSEFDRRNNRLVFRNLRLSQGPLSIRADLAEASRLDFENSQWAFKGNVELNNQGARVNCDDATLVFLGHELRSAAFLGQPARFEQQRAGGKRTEGRAGTIDYDVAAGSMSLANSAWVRDGSSEFSGDRISYDLRREYVTAQSGDSGPIRIKFDPPRRKAPRSSPPRP